MKHLLTMAVVVTSFLAPQAMAQDSNSIADSESLSQAQSQSASLGNQVLIDQSTPATRTVTNKQSGTATLKTAPSLGSLALGGGHPCAYSPATFQVSIIGGGGGVGGMKIDEACMARVAYAATGNNKYNVAADIIVAGRNFEACKAYYQAGLVSDCVDKKGRSKIRPVAAQQPTVSSRSKAKTIKTARQIERDNR